MDIIFLLGFLVILFASFLWAVCALDQPIETNTTSTHDHKINTTTIYTKKDAAKDR